MTEGLIERGEYKIKLGLQNAPVMAEQLALFDMGGNTPVYEVLETESSGALFPVKEIPQAVMDQVLYTAGNESNSAERIAVFYMRERPEAECAAFLRREFGTENGRGIEYEGRKYAVWFMEDGIHLAQGNSVRTGYERTTVSWERASARILELLETGTYLSPAELERAPDEVLREMADALLMTARDLNEDGRARGLFPQTLAIHDQRKGYPELDADMVAFAKSEGGLVVLAEEYHAFLDAYGQDRGIMRFRPSPYNLHRIGIVLDGLSYPERSFTAQPDFLRQCKMFITQDEIDRFFLQEGLESRLAVYSHFCYPHTVEEHQKFIKNSFGEYSGGARDGYDHTKTYKGLTYQREYARKQYDEVRLTIPNVVKTYERLISQKRFPGEDAIAKIPEYERERLARSIYHGFYNAPEEIPRPYPRQADFYEAVPVIRAQLSDMHKTAEMLAGLTTYLDSLDESDRYYDSCQNARTQLSAYVDGTFSLFNHRHDALQRDSDFAAQVMADVEQISANEPEKPEQHHSETVAFYSGEKNGLPFDVEVQVLRTNEPEPQKEPQADNPPALTPPKKREHNGWARPLNTSCRNYHITDDRIGEGAPLERFQRNLDAIRLLKTIEAEERTAMPEEQEVLAQYVGWGGLADFFDEKNARYDELKELLTDAEYAAARESTLTAFYTPPVVIRRIYAALEQMGFTQGNILEPSCGVGNFLGMLPENMAGSRLYGVELDDLSGRIARQLYQRSSIAVQGYEKAAFPDNFFDAAIGNVPFGQFKVLDKRYDRLNLPIHEYFIAKTLDKVRPGGVIAFVTSSFTMDKRTANVRKYIAQRAELMGAIRLPNNAFKAAAGTEVVSDILFLQKRDRMVDIEPEWVHLATNDTGIQMNSYFVDNPDMVLGEMKIISGPFGPMPTCEPYPDQPLDSLLSEAIQNIHGEITAFSREEELEGEDFSIEADPTVRNFSYALVDGKIYYRENSRMNPVEVSKTAESRIKGKSRDKGNVKAHSTYGTKRINAYEIVEDSLNLKDVRIFDYQYDAEGRKIAVLNKKETAIAQSKQELIKEAFAEWIWKDPTRRETLCKTYNILFNSNRPREYDGSHINFSGMNPEITLRKHQVNAIAHILYGGNTLLAHVVGAGKTFEMVAAAMESKRLGLCQKSLFVVPNHLTEQWASEFLQLYPAANILVATKKDFETKNRKRFCGRIATGDYDAVIIGHSQFEKIPMSTERQRTILEQQMEEILMGIREAKADKAENFTIKQMEKTRKGLQTKIDRLNDQSRKDDVVTFEELGVDRIFIDESHYFKNLFLYTKMRNVGGIAQTEAQKSSDLFMKCRYLDEITGGRGIIFATGTPISNSMVELYTIQRYLQMTALQEQGLQHFDSWAANYGETVTAIELSPEGYTLTGR